MQRQRHSGCAQTPPKIQLGHIPRALAVNPATNTVYVLNPGTPGTVSVIDGARCNAKVTTGCGTVPATVTVGNDSPSSRLEGVAVNPVTNTIYALNTADATISVIDGRTCNGKDTSGCGQTPAHAPVGRERDGSVAVDPTTNLVYVSNGLDGTVSIIDGATCNATDRSHCDRVAPAVAAGPSPNGLAVAQAGHTLYVADNGGGPMSFFTFEAPQRPTGVTATSTGRGQARVAWQPPRHGGLPIIYHVIPSPACPTCRGLEHTVHQRRGPHHRHRSRPPTALHVHGPGHRRGRHRAGLGALEPRQTLRPAAWRDAGLTGVAPGVRSAQSQGRKRMFASMRRYRLPPESLAEFTSRVDEFADAIAAEPGFVSSS